jgi:SNF2 family DNA or RNA helicase
VEHLGAGRAERLSKGFEGNGTTPTQVVIVSYGLLHEDIEQLGQKVWDTVVLDEAQYIKNPHSLRAQAAFLLKGHQRIALSGTPIENHLGDLWSLFHFLNPELLGSWRSFETHFAKPIQRDKDSLRQETLREIVRPFLLRRTKSQVLKELPPLSTIRREITLEKEDALRYGLLRKQIHNKLYSSAVKRHSKLEVLAEITRLRRFCCHPQLVFPEAPQQSAKVEALIELVEELRQNGHRALVFSQYVDFLHLVMNRLAEQQISYLSFDGSTPKAMRQNVIDRFQAGEGSLFLISLKAGGLGINLTAADYVIHLDPWWNPAVASQATDRAHRIGQERPVTVYEFVTRDTIEEDILVLHTQKRGLADALLEGGEQVAQLKADELKEWFQHSIGREWAGAVAESKSAPLVLDPS